MTLTETLCTVLIVLLISAMLAVGVRFAVRTYRESMELSETESLCSTLTATISDKARYSGEVGQNMFIQGVGTTDSGGGLVCDQRRRRGRHSDDRQRGVPAPRLGLLPAGPAGADDRHGETGFISYSAETGIFTVSAAIADAQGNILKETCFNVKRINAGKKVKKAAGQNVRGSFNSLRVMSCTHLPPWMRQRPTGVFARCSMAMHRQNTSFGTLRTRPSRHQRQTPCTRGESCR